MTTTVDHELKVGSFTFNSRLLAGTGKYENFDIMKAALDASGCEVVTVAVRRDIMTDDGAAKPDNILDHLDLDRLTILPNTAGCFNVKDAVRSAKLSRELLDGLGNRGAKWVKLEVLSDKRTLLPDPVGTLEATKILVEDGFEVLAYTSDDPILAKHLKEAGAASVMPLGSPIGSGLGILNPSSLLTCIEYLKDGDPDYPVIVDAGVGTASDCAVAMELGSDGVLLNTAIASAARPVAMARAMALAVEAGHLAFASGRIPRKRFASASSPMEHMIAASSGS